MRNYITVVPQQIGAIADIMPTKGVESAVALSAVPLGLPGIEVAPLTHTHISPRQKKSSPSASASPALPAYKTFDNRTIDRLNGLVHLRNLPQEVMHAHKPPKPSKRVKEKIAPVFGDDRDGNCQMWVDGSLIKVSKPSAAIVHSGGGKRNIIVGFSKSSRRRLLQKLAMLRQDAKPLFLTLTYPGEFPLEASEWKTHFDKWCKRLHRKYPSAGLVWRLEPQKRGAPHFHVLLYGLGALNLELRQWLSLSWYECVGSGDERHLRHGTDVQPIRSSRGVRAYAGKYLAKTQAVPVEVDEDGVITASVNWSTVGRWWGVRYSQNLPWSQVIGGKILSYGQSAKLMRYLRRYLKGQGVKSYRGSMPGMTVFVNNPRQWFENLDKLLC